MKQAGGVEKVLWAAGGTLAFVGGFIHMAESGGPIAVINARGISLTALMLWLPGIVLLGIAWLMAKARKD